MTNSHGKTKQLSPGDHRLPYARQGWEDARQGLPMDYDLIGRVRMSRGASYEQNRMQVLALRANGLPVPTWNATGMVPSVVRAAKLRAMMLNQRERDANRGGYYPTPSARFAIQESPL